MNLNCIIFATVFAIVSTAAVQVDKQVKNITNQLKAIERLEFSVKNVSGLLVNVNKMTSAIASAEREKLLSNPLVLERLNALFAKIIDEIVPGVFSHSKDRVIIKLSTKLAVFIESNNYTCDFSSRTRVKASQLLFVYFYIAENDRAAAIRYDRIHNALISGIEANDLPLLLDFFLQKMDISDYMLPDLLFEQEPCGALTFAMKIDCVKRVLKKAAIVVKLAEASSSPIQVDLLYAKNGLIRPIYNNLDDSILESACTILLCTADYALKAISYDLFFAVFKQALVTKTGPSMNTILRVFFHSAFVEQVALNWKRLSEDQKLTWERGIIYAFTLGKNEDFELTLPIDSVFGEEAKSLFFKLDLIQKLLNGLEDLDPTAKIEVLFNVYDRLVFKNLPREVFMKISGNVSEMIKVNEVVEDPLAAFASVLACLVFTQQFSNNRTLPDEIIMTILENIDSVEVPSQWQDRFETILHEQMPRVVNFIILSKGRIATEDLKHYLKLMLKYAPAKCGDLISALAGASQCADDFLQALIDFPDLYQLAFLHFILQGKRLDSTQLNISSTLEYLLESLQ